MKIVCTKKNLNQGLLTASRVISSGSTLPVLNNILLKTDGGRLNLEIAINTWVGGKIDEEGGLTVPARLVNDYVNNILTEKITLTTENQNLFIQTEKSKTHINGMSADEFPLIPKVGDSVYTRIDAKPLQDAISETVFATAFSETQPEISGVCFSFSGKTLTMAATDRYRLAETTVDLLQAVENDRQIILPGRAVHELGRVLTAGPVDVFLNEGQVMFRSSDTELISRLIDGQYPDYKQIIPQNFATEATVDRVAFIQSLKAASLFASDNNNVELDFSPQTKQVLIKSQSSQSGDSEIGTEAEIIGAKNNIIFNFRYILECLNNLKDDAVILKLIDASSPAQIVPAKRTNHQYIVMPIKI